MATRRKSAGKQRLYKMKGCNRKGCKKTMRRYRGGSNMTMNLAYPSNNIRTVPNPHLAYVGGKSSAYPNPGPPAGGFNFLNPQNTQKGGCGSCSVGGQMMKGGDGNNALVGSPWTPASSGWPGVDGVSGNSNYLAPNQYKVDPQTAMIATGANKPFSIGGRRRRRRSKKQKGGNLSNLFTQDLINLGRQLQFGVGSAYNGVSGYPAPVNPLPWKGQMTNTSSLASVKALL
jgi:hypothetical protein